MRVYVGLHFLQFLFKKFFFHSVSSFCAFCVCYESNILNKDIKICYHHLKRSTCYVILFSLYKNYKGSHQRCKKLLLKIWQYSQENNCWNLILPKLQVMPAMLLKKRLQNRCFLVNIAKFLRILHLKNICF